MYVIGIAGGSGSGKSTFALAIKEKFGAAVTLIRCDNYYLPHDDISLDERKKINYDSPTSIDFELLVSQLRSIKNGEDIISPVYDFTSHTRSSERETIKATPVIILDGILIFSIPELRDIFDLKIYVETDADERILRRARRDICERGRSFDDVIEQYLTTVKPMHSIYVEPTKYYADIIVNGGRNETALDIVNTKITDILHK